MKEFKEKYGGLISATGYLIFQLIKLIVVVVGMAIIIKGWF